MVPSERLAKSSIRPARILGRAGLLSLAVLLGYVIGTLSIFYRTHAQSAFQGEVTLASQRGEPFDPPAIMHLLWMHRFTAGNVNVPITPHSRYPNLIAVRIFKEYAPVNRLVEYFVATLFVVLCVVGAGCVASQFAPLRFAPCGLGRTHRSMEARLTWLNALRDSPIQWRSVLLAGGIIGFSAAILGESYAIVLDYIQYRISLTLPARAPGLLPVRPFFAILTGPDATWLLLGSFSLAIGSVVIAARYRLWHDPAVNFRWCLECGYPNPVPGHGTDPSPNSDAVPCPECGKPRGVQKQRVYGRHFNWVLAAIMVLSILTFFGVPSLVMSLPQ